MDAQPAVERDIALDIVKHGLDRRAGHRRGRRAHQPLGRRRERGDRARDRVRELPARGVERGRAAKISPAAVGGAALGGYVVRLALILVALVLLRHVSWIVLPWLGFTIVGAHLGLLFWETRYISLQLAAPGLRPRGTVSMGDE